MPDAAKGSMSWLLDVKIGHITALGRPPLATQQPPKSPIVVGAFANGDRAEVPSRSPGEFAAPFSESYIEHSPNKGVGKSEAYVYPEAPVRDLMGEQGEVISRVARTGKSCTSGDHEGDDVPQSCPTPR